MKALPLTVYMYGGCFGAPEPDASVSARFGPRCKRRWSTLGFRFARRCT
jgi:hypothetical protein